MEFFVPPHLKGPLILTVFGFCMDDAKDLPS